MGSNKKNVINLTYCIKSSSEMNTLKHTTTHKENLNLFKEDIKDAVNDINMKFKSNTNHLQHLHITELPDCVAPSQLVDNTTDLYLTLELSGYGTIKEEWKTVLIATGIAEGIIQGVVVSAATQNPWLGLAVGAEEIGQEYLTWNGVDWVLGETYAPVTLEGNLLYLKDQQTIWHDSSFVTENESELNATQKKDKSLQLKASLHKTEDELLTGLDNYLEIEILNPLTSNKQP